MDQAIEPILRCLRQVDFGCITVQRDTHVVARQSKTIIVRPLSRNAYAKTVYLEKTYEPMAMRKSSRLLQSTIIPPCHVMPEILFLLRVVSD